MWKNGIMKYFCIKKRLKSKHVGKKKQIKKHQTYFASVLPFLYIHGVAKKCIHILIRDCFEKRIGKLHTTNNRHHIKNPGKFTWCSIIIYVFRVMFAFLSVHVISRIVISLNSFDNSVMFCKSVSSPNLNVHLFKYLLHLKVFYTYLL